MSRGFVREGDQEELPVVPNRAYLPVGIPNFVTREGLDQLLKERDELLKEKDEISEEPANENEKRIARNYHNARLQLLNDRISEARVVEVPDQHPAEVTFGSVVTLQQTGEDNEQNFRIVGVDEADITRGRLSFISPLARALMNKKAGDSIVLKGDSREITYRIVAIKSFRHQVSQGLSSQAD